jgi:hypothetical protein
MVIWLVLLVQQNSSERNVFKPLLKLFFPFLRCVTTHLERQTDVDVEAPTLLATGPIVRQLATLSIFTEVLRALDAIIIGLLTFAVSGRSLAALPLRPNRVLIAL